MELRHEREKENYLYFPTKDSLQKDTESGSEF